MEKDDKLFVGEVMGDVREESVMNILNRFKWVIIGVVALVISGVVGMEISKSNKLKASIARTEAVNHVLSGEALTGDIASHLEEGSALSQMLLAKQAEKDGDVAKAISIYDAVAGNGANSSADRALAGLNKFALDDSLEAGSLAADGAPFQAEAQLILAQKLFAAGKTDEGLEVAQALHQNPKGDAMRSLIEMLILQNGGEISDEGFEDLAAEELPITEEGEVDASTN